MVVIVEAVIDIVPDMHKLGLKPKTYFLLSLATGNAKSGDDCILYSTLEEVDIAALHAYMSTD